MRPASIDKHLHDLERFFTEDTSGDPAPIEWQFGDGTDFHAMQAVRGLRRYIAKLESGRIRTRREGNELDELTAEQAHVHIEMLGDDMLWVSVIAGSDEAHLTISSDGDLTVEEAEAP